MKSFEFYSNLMQSGYGDEFKDFAKSIESNRAEVLNFEVNFSKIVDELEEEWDISEPHDKIIGTIAEILIELDDYLTDLPEERNMGDFIDYINHGNEYSLNVGWIDSKVGPVVWDSIEGYSDESVLLFAELGFLFHSHNYRFEKKTKEMPTPPMYAYHPERFKTFHEFSEDVGKIYRHKVDAKSGILTVDILNNLMGLTIQELNSKAMKYPLKLKLNTPEPSFVVESIETLATAYGRFVQAGRQIMDFPPALIEMLANTDIDDIPLDTIKTPYSSQYLYFGVQKDLELDEGWLVDGVYVEVRGDAGDIRFTVTASPVNTSLSKLWYIHPEPQYTQDFVGQYRNMDIATAIDTVFSESLNNLNSRINSAGGDITSKVKANLALSNEMIPESTTIIDVSPKNAATRLIEQKNRHPIYKAAIQLAVNALCYVTAYPDDIATVWPKGTPTTLSEKADNGKGKESVRAKSKLAALGYVPVHICGQRIEEQKMAAGHNGSTVTSHWRRGHWRNQVHGAGRALRKLIWVMPTLINSTKFSDENNDGHLYLISET